MLYVGLDDTDTLDSPGTGHLAREIAAILSATYPLAGVTRHQLLRDPRIPYTAKNSSAAILVDIKVDVEVGATSLTTVGEQVAALLAAVYRPGSDPGLVVASVVSDSIIDFGRRTQMEVVKQTEARALARAHDLYLRGLGGTEDGVIGALAAVGLAASGDDGRYIQVGRSRELDGVVSVAEVLAAGIVAVRTLAGETIGEGTILAEKLRPARRGGQPILFVEADEPHWLSLKLD